MRDTRKGFTLIEILIVVIILGILAGIVIPQFSSASSDARHSALASTVQSLRTQLEAYRIQHKDKLPPPAQFWTLLTSVTDADGNTPPAAGQEQYGPYMGEAINNSLNSMNTVVDGAVAPGSQLSSNCGYQYDYTNGTGKVWGTDYDGKTILP
jgi:prepilin-type N-terminal cleavage/methylation domain-containing protein